MTTPIKTQCPHCHTIFNIKNTQLNQKTATVCCEHCQQMFLVNNNLIVTADIDSRPQLTDTEVSSKKITDNQYDNNHTHSERNEKISSKTFNKKHTILATANSDDADILIHDDMDIDTSDDKNLEYDSLDSMDAWLTQATDNNYNATLSDTPLQNNTKHSDNRSESFIDLFEAADVSATSLTPSSSSAQVALSSTAANNIHANVDNTADDSWLEKLLKEQNQAEDAPSDDTDLSQLLLDMGIALQEEDNNQAEDTRRLQAQAKFSPTLSHRSVASLLWTLGCLVLALLLFAQYVMFNLNNLVKNPAHAERLQTLCSIVICSLPSADLTALSVSDINYQASRINTKTGFSDISAAITNQSSQAQLYPQVKVSIYGANALIGEFIAAPNEYLVGKQSQLAGNSYKQLLFTVPVTHAQITKIAINPIY
jgi:predicted Zn finger-like uncharacterized protein